ncbi:hypothetical protein MRB53_012732 [Persea americana]|uniref:Uncharacterized protein n=1 Tax=Persea americana TaxID=3435 RepID=A0ACC2LYH5_PERAE|nr:hypothetical protein MRB53_012732 [Persea americana]
MAAPAGIGMLQEIAVEVPSDIVGDLWGWHARNVQRFLHAQCGADFSRLDEGNGFTLIFVRGTRTQVEVGLQRFASATFGLNIRGNGENDERVEETRDAVEVGLMK